MENTPTETVGATSLTSLLNVPLVVALFFALAGAFFIGIVLLRRFRK